jgi:uncharacterized membrane protein YphA (DoxX/SURF4 family)
VQSYLFERFAGFDAHASRRFLPEWRACSRAGRSPLNCCRFSIGFATVVFLVALRVATGWHFFSQGMDHYRDPKWSSEGFLRQAKGPWADFYKSKAPDFHGFHELVSQPWRDPSEAKTDSAARQEKSKQKNDAAEKTSPSGPPTEGNPQPSDSKTKTAVADKAAAKSQPPEQPTEGDPSPAPEKVDAAAKRAKEQLEEDVARARPVYRGFADRVISDWEQRASEVAAHYGFDMEQEKQSAAVVERYRKELLGYLETIKGDLELYQRELRRLDQMQSFQGASDIPFASQRLADKQREVAGQPAAWLSDVRGLERGLNEELAAIATQQQRAAGDLPMPETSLKKTDRILTWAMLICGGCLIVGLFTRVAAVAYATFLFLVIMSQPPWVPGTITTLFPYQLVEMLALLALATTAVGRWGGLDFFLHFLITAPFRGRR